MGGSCRRPGCNRDAVVCITYDAVARQVWLDPIAGGHPSGQPLCDEHAERLNAPRAWVVVDRRSEPGATLVPAVAPLVAPTATLSSAAAAAVLAGEVRAPRRWGQIEPARPRPRFEAPIGVPAAVTPDATEHHEPPGDQLPIEQPAPDPATTNDEKDRGAQEGGKETKAANESVPKGAGKKSTRQRRRTRSDALLQPKGPLLSRAFEAGGEQRSAITVRGDDDDAPAND